MAFRCGGLYRATSGPDSGMLAYVLAAMASPRMIVGELQSERLGLPIVAFRQEADSADSDGDDGCSPAGSVDRRQKRP